MSQKIINSALEALHKNNFESAQKILLKLIKKETRNTVALTLLGIINFKYLRNPKDSLKYTELAIQHNSKDINSFLIAGVSAIHLGKHELANQYLRSGYQINRKHRDILFNLAINSSELGEESEAIELYRECILINNNDHVAKLNLANLLRKIHKNREAEKIYLELVDFDQAIIYKNYLSLLFTLQDYEKALEIAKKLCDKENNEENLIEYLRAAVENKKIELTERLIKKLENSNDKEYHYLNIVHLLNKDLYEKALQTFEELFDPYNECLEKKFITLYCIILSGLDSKSCVDEKYNHLLKINGSQNIKKFYSLWLLSNSNFKKGFSYYKSRLSEKQLLVCKPENVKIDDLQGKRTLWIGDQGIGDQLFYLRFLKKIDPIARSITLCIDERLTPLVKKYIKNYQIISKSISIDNELTINKDEYDVIQYLGDLPNIINLSPENINEYEFINQAQTINKKIDEKIRIGISWNSKNLLLENEKSISFTQLGQLISGSNCSFINLQYDNFDQVEKLKQHPNFYAYDEIDKKNNILALCDLIDSCDYVITVANFTAHLCGLRNKKTYQIMLNSKKNIWYWNQLNENKSLWYPSIEILNLNEDQIQRYFLERQLI